MARCPPIDELEAALSNGQAAEKFRAHFANCSKCRKRAERIEENNGFLRTLRDQRSRGLDVAVASVSAAMEGRPPGVAGFELLRELHRGGQGIVYLARQTATKRVVAIKMMLSAALATSRQRRRFEREIEIAAGLRHPRIVTVFESGATEDGWLWFAMEYVEGLPLDVFLNKWRPPESDALQLVASVCDAVAYAHQRGIIHRDLKPANILVDADGQPHVLDFGLAKVTGSSAQGAAAATRTGEFMGTFAYAAPEQFRGATDQIDTRTDVYALGTILYEVVTGRHPFPATGSLPEFIRAVDEREVVRPSQVIGGISTELEAIVLCALAREPARRYQSAGALGQDLLRYLRGEPVEARRDSRWYLLRKAAHRHRVAMSAAVIFIGLAIGLAVLSTVHARRIAHERDKALQAELETARTARTLAAALSESNTDRGRLLVRSGNIAQAERMIWPEWLAHAANQDERDIENPPRVTPILRWPPDHEAYWALWEVYAAAPCWQTIRILESPGPKVAIDRAGTLLAGNTRPGKLVVWSLPSMKVNRELEIGPVALTGLAFSSDGKLLATGHELGGFTMWDISTGNAVLRLDFPGHAVRQIIFPGDGRIFVVQADADIMAWDMNGRRVPLELPKEGGINVVNAEALSRRIAVGRSDGTVSIVDFDGNSPSLTFPSPGGSLQGVGAVNFSPDGKSLAVGRRDGTAELWDIGRGHRKWSTRLHKAATLSLDFSPDGARLASGGRDRTIQIANASDGRILRTLNGHTGAVMRVCYLGRTSSLASASTDGRLKLWDAGDRPAVRTLAEIGSTLFHIAISADGSQMVACAAGGDDRVQILNAATGKLIRGMGGHRDVVSGAAFSADGAVLATCSYDGEIRLWNPTDGECQAVLKGHENYVESIAYCLGGSRLASASDDNTVRLWDIASQTCVSVLRGHTGRCPMVAVSPDGQTIASCSIDQTIRLWSAADGAPLGVLSGHNLPIRAVCFTPDGKHLLSAGDETTIRIWDVAGRKCIATMDGCDQDVFCLAMSPDGRFVASTTRGGTVQLWSLARRRSLATLLENGASVFSACFSPDGKSLACCGEDGCVRLLDLTYFDTHIEGNRAAQKDAANVDDNPTMNPRA